MRLVVKLVHAAYSMTKYFLALDDMSFSACTNDPRSEPFFFSGPPNFDSRPITEADMRSDSIVVE